MDGHFWEGGREGDGVFVEIIIMRRMRRRRKRRRRRSRIISWCCVTLGYALCGRGPSLRDLIC